MSRTQHIVNAYERGEDLRSIANRCDVSHELVRKTLKRAGVSRRRRGRPGGMSADQLSQAKRLYVAGKSLYAISADISVTPECIRRHLLAAGVAMRRRADAIRLHYASRTA